MAVMMVLLQADSEASPDTLHTAAILVENVWVTTGISNGTSQGSFPFRTKSVPVVTLKGFATLN